MDKDRNTIPGSRKPTHERKKEGVGKAGRGKPIGVILMQYGIMLRSTTVNQTLFYYANVPKGYNRWVSSKEGMHRFETKKEADDVALKLRDQYHQDKGFIIVIELS
jgi:hypothetical protein